MLAARKGPEIIEEAFEEAKAKLTKVESLLEEIEGLDGTDDDWLFGRDVARGSLGSRGSPLLARKKGDFGSEGAVLEIFLGFPI